MRFLMILAVLLIVHQVQGADPAALQHGVSIPEAMLVEMFLQKNKLDDYSGGVHNIETNPVLFKGESIGYVLTFSSQYHNPSFFAFFVCKYDALPDYAQMLDSEWYVSKPMMHSEIGKELKFCKLTDNEKQELVISGINVLKGNAVECFRIYSFASRSGEGYSYYKPEMILETEALSRDSSGNRKTQISVKKVQIPESYPAFEVLKLNSSRNNSNEALKIKSIDRTRYYIINDRACTREIKVVPFKRFQWEEVFFNDINAYWELGTEKVLPIPSNPIEIELMKGYQFLKESCKKTKANFNTWVYLPAGHSSVEACIFYDANQGSNKAYLFSINIK